MTTTILRRSFSVLLMFAFGVSVQAQSPPPGPGSSVDPGAAEDLAAQTRMQEDIEVMRLILGRMFQRLEASQPATDWKRGLLGEAMSAYPGMSPTIGMLGGMSGGMPMGGLGSSSSGFGPGGATGDYYGYESMSGYPEGSASRERAGGGSVGVEGFYLAGYGIVFTVSLPHALFPAHGAQPLPEPAQPKPRVWEQVRQELTGAALPDADAERKAADVSECVLQVLAENGSNLSQLGNSERVAILISFRRDDPRLLNRESAMTPGSGGDVYAGSSGPPSSGGSGLLPGPQGLGFPGEGAGAPAAPMTGLAAGDASVFAGTGLRIKVRVDVQNYELLGDLHLKQGKPQEAAASYQKAADIQPRLELLTKLAQALLAAGNVAEARQALERASTVAAGGGGAGGGSEPGTGNVSDHSAFPLPRKLIISAPKSLLDQIGAGNISLEGFRQQVSVQSF